MRREDKIRRLMYLLNTKNRTSLILITQNLSNKISGYEVLLKPFPYLIIDFNEINDRELEKYLQEISSLKYQIILFHNIDKITLGGDKEYWESIITIALKQENYPIEVQDKEGYFKKFELPFQDLKIITTCSKYPEFLKDKGILGEIIDFRK